MPIIKKRPLKGRFYFLEILLIQTDLAQQFNIVVQIFILI